MTYRPELFRFIKSGAGRHGARTGPEHCSAKLRRFLLLLPVAGGTFVGSLRILYAWPGPLRLASRLRSVWYSVCAASDYDSAGVSLKVAYTLPRRSFGPETLERSSPTSSDGRSEQGTNMLKLAHVTLR
jgi:hypothetical protein